MLYAVYSIILLLFSVYSYSQIDLNLTLSSNQIYQNIQQQLILLGYYNRPLSTLILVILIVLLYLIYIRILLLVKKNKLTVKNIVFLILITCIILFFSYSAFSHDLFNYMFDARIIAHYGQNPYLHSALDFPSDPWTRFMHWTHRTYPYGPIWLIVSVIPSFFGFGKFVLTLFNFKLMFTLFHMGNTYLIYKILTKISPKQSLFGTAFYAFNPVILIESLVSPHNEVAMLFFLLWSIYLIFAKSNKFLGIINNLLSAGIKFVPIILMPFLFFIKRNKHPEKNDYWILLFLGLLSLTLLIEIIYREPYSWYFIPIIGLGALLIRFTGLSILISGISLAACLRYLPFIYIGEYNKSALGLQNSIFFVTIILTVLTVFVKFLYQKKIFMKS